MFRKLGNVLIDLDRVRAIIPITDTIPKGYIAVIYADHSEDAISDDTPVETVAALYESLRRETSYVLESIGQPRLAEAVSRDTKEPRPNVV